MRTTMLLKNALRPVIISFAALASCSALPATIRVDTTADELNSDGDCSLREAVEAANTNSIVDDCEAGEAGSDTILLVISGAMSLGMGELVVTEALEVQGFFDDLTINAGADSRHFLINMPDNTHDFSISFVTLSAGDVPDTGGGSILALQVGTLTENSRQTIADFAIRAEDSASVELGHNVLWTDSGIAPLCRVDTGATVTSLGYNLVGDNSCAPVPTDLIGVDPGLGVLGDYGGPAANILIRTRLPVPGSPLIDGGNVNCPAPGAGPGRGGNTTVDQRGEPRPQAGPARGASALCDIGAVEYQPGFEPIDGMFDVRFESSP